MNLGIIVGKMMKIEIANRAVRWLRSLEHKKREYDPR
jgi:hypothetical protein